MIELSRTAALFQFVLGTSQIVAATVCLYFLLTRGEDRLTFISALVAFLLTLLSLSLKLAWRYPRKSPRPLRRNYP